ncbi:MAG: pyridoxamine 5'-phosphate oxidase family protein [Actinomycetota bacterium]|jgi:nitroimidazol reductase NimA-like FMN-containing flavoprotein (pyridoxamine 5'-phosphate oxidase superfamily)|nr:pyridoxamine 5'-phosphate oxidase family protein [Actinomycetota bacterium]|tara:strand:+ start:2302 stop:2724 length:423 start_codon:yes stop_codon:yes gene_type:complete
MAEMNDEERDNFLNEVRVGILAIERNDKGPLCAPIWYRYSTDLGFEIAMAYDSAKSILLRRHGAATICVQDEQLPYRYVTAEGQATVELMTPEERDEVLRDIAIRYLGEQLGNQYADAFPGHEEAKVTIKPRRWNSDVLG